MSNISQNEMEFSFDLIFEKNTEYSNNKPPDTPPMPPSNNKNKMFKSPKLKWNYYENETPPQFYLNQKFDFKKRHKSM
tara:strand:+ start:386 stop:619 length:234 start_codon:yes stop_codon:yes gene_type:complete